MLPAMTRSAREEFLAGVHVGVLGVEDPRSEGAPLVVPVWYSYAPGGPVVVQTARASLKARLIGAAGRFSLCAQQEEPPYRYVSVEGPVVDIADPADPDERRALAVRYLGESEAEQYLAGTSGQLADDITVRMRPERWRTADFSAFAESVFT